ncbi:MAG: Stp1/IreP family PP2C-type Ser/Thr phosphatase [SAR324 cluster bacterium]|uniref:Stp1/IreP family PP2C-type Ser/Thr phosphatase n=1 Tax=SAR324 cluster bacterium TaxID=2024889 RepID=A0A7X9IJV4_9DELT|nr:Stp1/IreP family PP2C-type Ser/Thr phosphatase [SAR324 cluster bacterium]
MTDISADGAKNILDALRYVALSDIGMRREENQDSYGAILRPGFRVFIVADGMGGAQGGGIASKLAIDTIENIIGEKDEITSEEFLEAVYESNSAVFNKASESPELLGMGTTFVSLLFVDTALYIVHVGDSRAYRIRKGKTTQLTEDHTLVKELVKSGAISAAQAENHPISHMLTRSLGPSEDTVIDLVLSPDGPVQGDVYLLCSDGLYNLVQESEFNSLIQGVSLEEAAKKLVALANERGGTDNITVMLVEIGEEYPVTLDDVSSIEEEKEVDVVSPAGELDVEKDGKSNDGDKEPEPKSVSQILEITQLNDENSKRIDLLLKETAEILANQKRSETDSKIRKFLLVIVVCFLLTGMWIGKLAIDRVSEDSRLSSGGQKEAKQIALVQLPMKERPNGTIAIHKSKYVIGPRDDAPKLDLPVVATLWHEDAGDISLSKEWSGPAEVSQNSKLVSAEEHNIQERKADLRKQIAQLEVKLTRFSQPINSEFSDHLKGFAERLEELNREMADLRQELDVATRRLSVWYDRKKRLEVGDPINMASEVAVSSNSVREKKESFEKITWDYLKELEILRFNQNDKEQERKAAALLNRRTVAVRELTAEVKSAIEENISRSNQEIAELTQQRDRKESEIEEINREEAFIKSILNASPEERDNIRTQVAKEKLSLEKELEELQRILPDENED